jgi:hypothetical protein
MKLTELTALQLGACRPHVAVEVFNRLLNMCNVTNKPRFGMKLKASFLVQYLLKRLVIVLKLGNLSREVEFY